MNPWPADWPIKWRRLFLLTLPISLPLWFAFMMVFMAVAICLLPIVGIISVVARLWDDEDRPCPPSP